MYNFCCTFAGESRVEKCNDGIKSRVEKCNDYVKKKDLQQVSFVERA